MQKKIIPQPQVESQHYRFENYFNFERWSSLFYQLKEIVTRSEIKSVLEVGPGTKSLEKLVGEFRPDVNYHSVDISEHINPTYIAGVTKIPVEDSSFNLVCVFQVLEHIPYEEFENAIIELKRVSNSYVFISLPDSTPAIRFLVKIPFFRKISFLIKVPKPQKHVFNGQHYWEIGKSGYNLSKIKEDILKHFDIQKSYVPFENYRHRFFILTKKTEKNVKNI